jgi:citrate lyase subunit beta/citryl-CoA lyase
MTRSALPPSSLLFVPASNQRALSKARTLGQDGTIIDLEDAVGEAERPQALKNLSEWLAKKPSETLAIMRISDGDAGRCRDQIACAREGGIDAVLLPKVSGPDLIMRAREEIRDKRIQIWAMIETARGVIEAPGIARAIADTGSGALIVGPNDLRREVGMAESTSRNLLKHVLMSILLAARAAGVMAFDGVYNDFRDAEGFAREVAETRAMGFDGKTLIHPSQVGPTHQAFAPTGDELAWARAVISAFDSEGPDGRAVLSIDGRMVERLHLTQAHRILARQT